MKNLTIKLILVGLTWVNDLTKFAAEGLYFFEHGKTIKQAREDFLKEFLKEINTSAHDAKEQFYNRAPAKKAQEN